MTPRIVVGVDGSSGAQAALRWAAEEARLRDAVLVAVHAWNWPYVADVAYLAHASLDHAQVEADAKAAFVHALEAADIPDDVRIEEVLTEGLPAAVLLDAAKGAAMLVVGTRGRGGFTGLLLGSVSQQCAHHAPCPVVIVPTPPEAVDG